MATIHHNTLKKAAAHGLTIEPSLRGGQFNVINAEGVVATGNTAKDALDLAILALNPPKAKAPKDGAKSKKRKSTRKAKRKSSDEDGEDDDESEEDATRSIVKAKYREKYRPHKMTNGDSIAKRCATEFMTLKDEDTKKPRLDFERFVKFAKDNGCWVESYRSLKNRHGDRNNGLIRMNVVNRLRAKVRNKEEIMWPK